MQLQADELTHSIIYIYLSNAFLKYAVHALLSNMSPVTCYETFETEEVYQKVVLHI
jgi:hypothetical protein